MKKLNEKGFTLIELLAVIIILGVLLLVAIPSMNNTILNAKKDSFITTAKQFISYVRYEAIQDTYALPTLGNATVVSRGVVELERGGKVSSFDGSWDDNYSYIVIYAAGSNANKPDYQYYIVLQDSTNSGCNLTSELSMERKDILYKNFADDSVTTEKISELVPGTSTIKIGDATATVTQVVLADGTIVNPAA